MMPQPARWGTNLPRHQGCPDGLPSTSPLLQSANIPCPQVCTHREWPVPALSYPERTEFGRSIPEVFVVSFTDWLWLRNHLPPLQSTLPLVVSPCEFPVCLWAARLWMDITWVCRVKLLWFRPLEFSQFLFPSLLSSPPLHHPKYIHHQTEELLD